jgi:hypothetical protein
MFVCREEEEKQERVKVYFKPLEAFYTGSVA